MNKIKSYLVFTPLLYRLIILIGYPAAAIAAYYLAYRAFHLSILIMPCMIAIAMEIFGDYFIFGGIAKKSEEKVEYLKCSNRGMSVFQGALLIDDLRRYLWLLIINLGTVLVLKKPVFLDAVMVTTITYTLIMLALTLTRFSTLMMWNMIATYAVLMIFCFVYGIILTVFQPYIMLITAVAACLALALSWFNYKLIIRSIGGSYYDGEI